VGNLGQVDDHGETSLAAATAAIITTRWNCAGHQGWTPPSPPAPPAPAQRNGNGTGRAAVSSAAAPPSMFTPAGLAPAPDVFASTDRFSSDTFTPDAFTPDRLAPSEPAPPDDFGFSDSVMADLALPKLLLPEQYDPNRYEPGYSPNGYDSDAYVPRPAYSVDRDTRRPDPLDIDTEAMLPQRIPAKPDVPAVQLPPNDPLLDPTTTPVADGAELTRIADLLRQYDVDQPAERPDGFDLAAVLEAVRSVPGVRDAQLRWNSGSGHTLRIEFFDGVDEGQVTREVARLLRETMGLAAQPSPPAARRMGQEETTPAGGMVRPRPGVVSSAPVPVRPMRPSSAALPTELEQNNGRPFPRPTGRDGRAADLSRVVLDHVQVTTLGVDATVEVRLAVSGGSAAGGYAVGKGHGPAVDAYLLRLAATAAGDAVDQVLVEPGTGTSRGRCFVEHVAVVPFAGCEVAVVVLLLVCGSFAEQLAGSAIVVGDPRQAVVRATLSAVNRRLESLLA